MDHFTYRNGVLHAGEIALPEMAERVGTPLYCYSAETLRRHFQVFSNALPDPKLVCYAVKANSNLAVLRVLANEGSGADVVSEGEIRLALAAGIPPQKIVFSGVGKRQAEMRYALEQGIFQFNVESLSELCALSETAAHMGSQAAIAVRVNPDVDPKTHAKISTGQRASKFGIPLADAMEVYRQAASLPGIRVQGVSVHIGSQLTDLEPFRQAYRKLREFVGDLRREGFAIHTIDLGGGLGIPYRRDGIAPPLPALYGELVRETMSDMDATLLFEPGRLIAGNAGILLTRVIYVKESAGQTYVILDAAMNDLIRPSLYDAHHDIIPVTQYPGRGMMTADIVGPVCESGDTFAVGRELPHTLPGELLAFRSAGAYGAVMASSYNARPLTPEVLVDGSQWEIVRARPNYGEMLAQQRIPDWLET